MLNDEHDSRNAWKWLKTLSGQKKKSTLPKVDDDPAFAEELNQFQVRFNTLDFHEECNTLVEMLINQNDEKIVFTEKEVNIAPSKINTRN